MVYADWHCLPAFLVFASYLHGHHTLQSTNTGFILFLLNDLSLPVHNNNSSTPEQVPGLYRFFFLVVYLHTHKLELRTRERAQQLHVLASASASSCRELPYRNTYILGIYILLVWCGMVPCFGRLLKAYVAAPTYHTYHTYTARSGVSEMCTKQNLFWFVVVRRGVCLGRGSGNKNSGSRVRLARSVHCGWVTVRSKKSWRIQLSSSIRRSRVSSAAERERYYTLSDDFEGCFLDSRKSGSTEQRRAIASTV